MGNKQPAQQHTIDTTQFERVNTIVFTPQHKLTLHHYQIFQDHLEGLKLWEGAIVLVRYLLDHPDQYANKSVLDLGAGMGVVGIATSAFLKCPTLMVDYQPKVLDLCKKNVQANISLYPNNPPRVQLLDWNTPDSFDFTVPYDLVIGCELVYSITNSPSLVSFLSRVLTPTSTLLLIIPTCRSYSPQFMQALKTIDQHIHMEERILDNPQYISSPVEEGVKDDFYPIRELTFKLLIITRAAAPNPLYSPHPVEMSRHVDHTYHKRVYSPRPPSHYLLSLQEDSHYQHRLYHPIPPSNDSMHEHRDHHYEHRVYPLVPPSSHGMDSDHYHYYHHHHRESIPPSPHHAHQHIDYSYYLPPAPANTDHKDDKDDSAHKENTEETTHIPEENKVPDASVAEPETKPSDEKEAEIQEDEIKEAETIATENTNEEIVKPQEHPETVHHEHDKTENAHEEKNESDTNIQESDPPNTSSKPEEQ